MMTRALAFVQGVGFPSHAVVAMGVSAGQPEPSQGLYKGLTTPGSLETAVHELLGRGGVAHIESDMRAHVNPTRMQAIERAARDLARLALSGCRVAEGLASTS